MPRVPLRNAGVRPPEGVGGAESPEGMRLALLGLLLPFALLHGLAGSTRLPLQEGERNRCERAEVPRLKGHGWPCEPTPGAAMSERTLRVQGRMQGALSSLQPVARARKARR